ncbi:MAG TPA: aminoglycoside phosphotransferase family protein [Bacilli bacterium]|nr:aminoglycoside phosphotransferase family protein [Bacilli bacterium]
MNIEKRIRDKLNDHEFTNQINGVFTSPLIPIMSSLTCLKHTNKSSIWRFNYEQDETKKTMIIKIYLSATKNRNRVELEMLTKASDSLKPFMAEVYFVEANEDEVWVFMEYVEQLRGQIKTTPELFAHIIPTIAKLHAKTLETNKNAPPTIPRYDSKKLVHERMKDIEKTKKFLGKAMKHHELKKIVKPHDSKMQTILAKGPHFFPELLASPFSLIHGDLHFQNICCHNVADFPNWTIRFIDWETAKIAPGWFDMAVLVEILIDFRKDWHERAEEIRTHSVQLYTKEMKKYGIIFQTDPLKLYKMAYLQRTLEKGIYTHLRRELAGREGKLLQRYLEKVALWGNELQLY